MAPRVRTKKRGNLRIDAALDAMNPFGFPRKLVRDTVKELLIVYGGDDGWVFIEEGSYTLLIDTLLEKLKDGGAIEKVHEENGRAADHHGTSVAGCSSSVINEASSSNPGAEITMKQREIVISSYVDDEAFRIAAALPANDSGPCADESYPKDDIAFGDDDHFRSSLNQSLVAPIPKIRRQKPYHGWISSSDDGEDLVHLTPAQLPEEFAKLFTPRALRKRKKCWDVNPSES